MGSSHELRVWFLLWLHEHLCWLPAKTLKKKNLIKLTVPRPRGSVPCRIITLSKALKSRSTILGGVLQGIPALLYIMSSLVCRETAKSTAFAMSDSLVTSQRQNAAFGPSSCSVSFPRCGWMSAMTTLAPWLMNFPAVALPIPLAPPVMSATLPSSFLLRMCYKLYIMIYYYVRLLV